MFPFQKIITHNPNVQKTHTSGNIWLCRLFFLPALLLGQSGCSTISEGASPDQITKLGRGVLYPSCDQAARKLYHDPGNDRININPDKTVLVSDKGPRCNVSKHVFAINKHGALRTVYGPKFTGKGTPKKDRQATLAAVRKGLLATVRQGLEEYLGKDITANNLDDKKILVYIHGGLVGHKSAIKHAEVLAPWAVRDGYYPIFLVWDSSLNSTYLDYLAFTTDGERNGKKKNQTVKDIIYNGDGFLKRGLLLSTRLIGDIGTGIAKAPENYVVQFDNYLERLSTHPKSKYRLDVEDFLDTGTARKMLIFPEFTYLPRKDNYGINQGTSWYAPNEMRYHALFPSRLALTTTSEIGRNSWDNMMRRTRLATSTRETSYSNIRNAPTPKKRAAMKAKLLQPINEDVGGFAQAMDLINDVLASYDHGETVKFTLTGHSMGAIIANEILWAYPDYNYDKIIYMAPAGSIREFNRMALPIIRQSHKNNHDLHFYNLMLHPLAESRERQFGGIPPQGSLLEWIDEMFEGPRNIEEKTLGKYRNARRFIDSYDPDDQEFMTFRVFPVQEKFQSPFCDFEDATTHKKQRCHPLKHGQMDDYTFWRKGYLTGLTK